MNVLVQLILVYLNKYTMFALDRIDEHCVESDNDENVTIDNENILVGDEHTQKITGSPLETCMSLENPESDNKMYSIAPAEGEKPISFMTDKNFEALCNPCNFPYGTGTSTILKENENRRIENILIKDC